LPTLFLDENIPREVREWLIKKGFQLTSVARVDLKGALDQTLAEYASEHKLTIVTLDNHFAHIYQMLKKRGLTVIIIKANPAIPRNIIQIIERTQSKIDLREAENKLIIISKKKVRIIT
jgi:predicted nuclease of predicted toxin-antitoxin system